MQRLLIPILLLVAPLLTKAQSVLWEISGNGLKKPSYVFGTIHIQDKRVFELDKSFYKKLKSCKTFAMEITPDGANLSKIAKGMMLENGKTLKDIYTAEEYQLIADTLLKYTGMPIVLFNTMKPFALSSVMMSATMKKDMGTALDVYLYNFATEKGMETKSIETVEEQISAMEGITPEYVLEGFKDPLGGDEMFEKLVNMYLNAQLDSLHNYLLEEDSEGFDTKELLDKRNKTMADRIVEMANEKPVFAAIGAGHLWGDLGVINLLRKKGFKVEPVILPTKK